MDKQGIGATHRERTHGCEGLRVLWLSVNTEVYGKECMSFTKSGCALSKSDVEGR